MTRHMTMKFAKGRIAWSLLLGLAIGLVSPAFAVTQPKGDVPAADELMVKGSAAFQRGHFEEAVRSWKAAGSLYHQHGKPVPESRALAHLAESYQTLGMTGQAIQTLELALGLAQQGDHREWQIELLGRIGTAYLDHRQLEAAGQYLGQALEQSRDAHLERVTAAVLNDLGRWHAQQQHYEEAVKSFTESAFLAKVQGERSLQLRAVLNNGAALVQLNRFTDAGKWTTLSSALLEELPPSYEKTMGLLTYGLLSAELRSHVPDTRNGSIRTSAQAFESAARLADAQGDARTASYAWGYLGRLYEQERRYEEALTLSRRAMQRASAANAPESLFRWHWQTARLLMAGGRLDEAIDSYRQAVYTLQPLRPELAVSADHPTNVLDLPARKVYLELADALLQRAALTEQDTAVTNYLKEAREVVELQKVAELRDYYRDECVDALQSHAMTLDVISPTTAVLYPIVFPDRTELLISLPTGLKRVPILVTLPQLTQEVRTFRRLLERRTTREYLPHAQQLYAWLIRPLEEDLTAHQIETLVIVPDAALRTIPLAALHDGQQFLIRRYAVATTPGLSLTNSRPIDQTGIRLLSGGLTEGVRGFPPLPDVATELHALKALYGGDQLVNQQFLLPKLEQELKENPYNVVHLASHGKFEGDAAKTYLLTYDGRLGMDRLARFVGMLRFRSEPLELLTLSACETATGNDSAALGLAGVAIKAGAKSALATLWYINDQASAQLVTEFYEQLKNPASSKARALQLAQWKLLDDPIYEHPAYWSPFLLLNNWL